MPDLPDAPPHGSLDEVFPDVFFVSGSVYATFGTDTTWTLSRNMTVLREGGDLVLVNTMRLDDAGLAALDALGAVKRVVRLGAFHGKDDAFYAQRYGAELWAPAGLENEHGHPVSEVLTAGSSPAQGSSAFLFETSKMPEAVLHLDREGGILIACDSLQNWVGRDPWFDDETFGRMGEMGFIAPANVGPGWMQFSQPQKPDFDRLAALSFRHVLPSHGVPLKDSAKEDFTATFDRLFSS